MLQSLRRFISYLFFSNIFLGIIAVALCIATNLLCGLSLNYLPFYVVVFLGTSLYYTLIYVHSANTANHTERTLWYQRNLPNISKTVNCIIACICVFVLVMFFRNSHRLQLLHPLQWLLLGVFPLLAAWYTFSPRFLRLKNIRSLGMVKPFIIGLTWSGFVTIYPVIIWQLQKGIAGQTLYPSFWLWADNFVFISILAIIFDIKDYRTDTLHHLSTFPVVFGIRNTLRKVVLPLLLLNICLFALFQTQHSFSLRQMLLQSLPYLLLLIPIFQHSRPKSLLYYLAGIDGLMLLKALCIIGSLFFL